MYKLIYADEANNDLQSIFDHIAHDDELRASNYLGEIEKQMLRLQDFRHIGHDSKYAELYALGIKVLPYDDYLIFYTVTEKTESVNIVRVLHGSVNYKRLF